MKDIYEHAQFMTSDSWVIDGENNNLFEIMECEMPNVTSSTASFEDIPIDLEKITRWK